jgi:thioredoxin reductase (NADPH)
MKKDINYDFIVIGAGGAGLAASIYAARFKLKTLVLGCPYSTELPIGGVITTTHVVENYPGFMKISGKQLAKEIEDHAKSYDLVEIKEEQVIEIKKSDEGFMVKTNKSEYNGKTILFATGTKYRKLPESVKGSKEFENKGVSYCALCDAPLFKDKIVAVIGGSNSAAKNALLLAEYAERIYLIYRGEQIRPEPITLERVKENKKIEIINNTNIIEVKGKSSVESIILDKKYKNSNELKTDGVFVTIGHMALSDLAKQLGVELNKAGEIKINHLNSETNIPGVYAAGDVTDRPFKQLITGVADGCTAAYSVYEYIKKKKVFTY